MVTDSIADLLTRIRNAQGIGRRITTVPSSRVTKSILAVLAQEGFIKGWTEKRGESSFNEISVELKYSREGYPGIRGCRRVSRPGRRKYIGKDSLARVSSGLGIGIISTSQGIISDREARKRGIGGELMAIVR